MQTKYCSGCGEIKSTDLFNKNRSTKDGYNNYCGDCHRRTSVISRQKQRSDPEGLERSREFDRIKNRNRRAQKNNAESEKFFNLDIFERDNWVCQICGEFVDKNLEWPDPKSKSIDHIIPLSKGGSDTSDNVRLTHLVCNLSKGIKI